MSVHFLILQKKKQSLEFKLDIGEEIIIGRSNEKADLVLEDELCSSAHCKISVSKEEIFIEDLNSKNGTFLNGEKIYHQNFYLKDKIKFAQVTMYINPKKMNKHHAEVYTFKGSEQERAESLQFTPDQTKTAHIIKQKQKVKTRYMTTRQGASSKSYQKRQENKQKELNLKRLYAYLIDFIFSILVFSTCLIISSSLINQSEIKKLDQSPFDFIFTTENLPLTAVSLLITIAMSYMNLKKIGQSIGERAIKLWDQ